MRKSKETSESLDRMVYSLEDHYQHNVAERRRLLADHGFVRGEDHIWRHTDGRAIGEGVMSALIDRAFARYLGVDLPLQSLPEMQTNAQDDSPGKGGKKTSKSR